MHIEGKRAAYVGLGALLWWTVEGALNAANYHQMNTRNGIAIPSEQVLRTSMASAWLWVPLTVAIFWAARRFPIEGARVLRHTTVHLGGAVAVILVRALVVYVGNDLVGWYRVMPPLGDILFTSVGNNFFMYWLIAGAAHALHFAQRSRENALHAARFEAQLAQARLAILQAQLHPHFLFNALHSLSELVHRDAAAADRMIVRLSELLRQTLSVSGAHEVSLRDEIELVEPYLEIEQIRFGERLTVEWDIDPAALEARVPRWILQPLVENSLRHGLAPSASPGRIRIAARAHGARLELAVHDSGVGLSQGWEERGGVGLANTRARLRELHGEDHRFDLLPSEPRGAVATIDIPLARAAHA